MNDDLIQLASTYLDGEATPAERAQVDGDPELLAEVERLRRVRAVLIETGPGTDTGTAPISMRERHLAAALDTWDRLPQGESSSEGFRASSASGGGDDAGAAGGASITAPVSLSDQRKKRRSISPKLLTAAAAVLVLGGAAFVIQNAVDSDSDESFDSAATAELSTPSEADDFEASPEAAAEEFIAADDEAGEAADVADAPSPPADIEVESDAGVADDGLERLEDEADLAVFANDRILFERSSAAVDSDTAAADEVAEESGPVGTQALPTAGNVGPTEPTAPPTLAPPVDLCGLVDRVVGFAVWGDEFSDEPITVGIDDARGDAVGYRSDDCTEVARTPLLPIDD